MNAAIPAGVVDPDASLATAVVEGDEVAFLALLHRYHPSLVRLAQVYLPDPAAAEAVAQATWMTVLQGLPCFDRRSALRTWLFGILVSQARAEARRAGCLLPGAEAGSPADELDGPAVDPGRFRPEGVQWAGGWASPPLSWDAIPPERLEAPETRAVLEQAIAQLPAGPRAVLTLRDVEGWPAAEVGAVLGLDESRQRALLNQGRAHVRSAVAQCLTGEGVAA